MSNRIYYSEETEQRARRNQVVIIAFAAGVSAAIGAAIALLFSPQSGAETRETISDGVSASVENGRKAVTNASEQIRETASTVRNDVNDRIYDVTNSHLSPITDHTQK